MPEPRDPALDLIQEEFPVSHQRFVGPALRRAYAAATELIERTDWLDGPSGKFHRGDLILLAAESEFTKLIVAGHLPGFDFSYEDYTIPTGKHLVMRTRRAIITISQVATINSCPRSAEFRTNIGAANSLFLFPEMNEAEERERERKHLLIIHGYQTLSHAAIAMPHAVSSRLIARTSNLLDLDAGDFGTHPEPEGPTEPPDLGTIEDVIRIVRDTK